jgi:hypothetical protein
MDLVSTKEAACLSTDRGAAAVGQPSGVSEETDVLHGVSGRHAP